MKKLLVLTICLVLAFSIKALADEGDPRGGLREDILVSAEVGPYAQVFPQRVTIQSSEEEEYWWFWAEDTPGMDFGHYDGRAGYGKAADSNCFLLETNTNLTVTFSGQSLTHESGDKMLTRYWAWRSRGVSDLSEPWLFLSIPRQLRPYRQIGYFGEAGKAPRKDKGREIEDITFNVLQWLSGNDYWPSGDWDGDETATHSGVTTNGWYAFQVFGFASTDEISSQRAGDYVGKIILTVSK